MKDSAAPLFGVLTSGRVENIRSGHLPDLSKQPLAIVADLGFQLFKNIEHPGKEKVFTLKRGAEAVSPTVAFIHSSSATRFAFPLAA